MKKVLKNILIILVTIIGFSLIGVLQYLLFNTITLTQGLMKSFAIISAIIGTEFVVFQYVIYKRQRILFAMLTFIDKYIQKNVKHKRKKFN